MKIKIFNICNKRLIPFCGTNFHCIIFCFNFPQLALKVRTYECSHHGNVSGNRYLCSGDCLLPAGVRTFWQKLFVEWRFYTAPILFILALVAQWLYVLKVHPAIGFDVSAVHDALLTPNNPDIRGYFSVNYNNLPILLFQHWLSTTFHANSWFFFAMVSVGFTALSAVLNLGSVAVINWRKLPAMMYIQAVWLLLFPMSVVPYTDTWSLPFVSLYILCYLVMARANYPVIMRLLAAVLGGGALIGAYLIKPSAVIPLIALVLVSLLALLQKQSRSWWLKGGLCLLVMLGTFGYGLSKMETVINHQDLLMVDKKRENPPLHFIQIGMTGDGGYSPQDDLMMGKLYSKQEKEAYSLKRIKATLRHRGLGYAGFLVAKHGRNTADATFSWGLEGHFFKSKADHHRVKMGIASFVYPNGDNLDNFRFVAQLVWIIFLGLIAFGWQQQRLVVQALRLGMIGGFIFLLIFEGGRSRYLIQFLPVLFLIATLVSQSAVQKLRSLFSWVHH